MSKRKYDNKSSHWIIAAGHAREEIAKAKNRIRQLKRSVAIFTRKDKAGEPWPGDKKQSATPLHDGDATQSPSA